MVASEAPVLDLPAPPEHDCSSGYQAEEALKLETIPLNPVERDQKNVERLNLTWECKAKSRNLIPPLVFSSASPSGRLACGGSARGPSIP